MLELETTQIEKAQILNLKSGDTVIFYMKQNAKMEDIKMFEGRIRGRLPAGVNIITLNSDVFSDAQVMRKE